MSSSPSNDPAALLERLREVGLEEKEASLYLHLCLHGPSKASEAAAAAKLNRTEAYRSLDNLMKRGFVTASLDRPTLYDAAPPEKVFDDALAQHTRKRGSLERARDAVIDGITELRGRGEVGSLRTSYKIVQGRAAIYAATESMLRRARVNQSMVSTYFAESNATESNIAYITTIQRAKDGLPMRLLIKESPGSLDHLREITHLPGIEIRFLESAVPVRFTIVDDREIVVWLTSDPDPALSARDDIAMWTNAVDFVRSQRIFYDALWERSRPMRKTPRPSMG